MDRQKILMIRMDPRMMLKLKIMLEAVFDDVLEFISKPVVKVVLWLMSIITAFAAGMAI